MTSSLVEIASTSGSVEYKGSVTSLNGTTIVGQVSNASGQTLGFSATVSLGSNGASFTGVVAGSKSSSFSNGVPSYSGRGSESRDH